MDEEEARWIDGVERRLGASAGMDDETKRIILRLTKITADVTGVRYLAPLTAFVVGRAAGRAEAAGGTFDLRAAAEAVSELAGEWGPPGEG
jgi:hypothetical protein